MNIKYLQIDEDTWFERWKHSERQADMRLIQPAANE